MSENENPMMGMSDKEKREYIINKAMEIIMNSGDARNYAAQARDEINNGNYAKAAQLLKEADKVQTAAHVTQTEMIQGDIRGGDEAMQYSVLFAHAQDTLMTIQVEINMTKAMLKMAESFEKRFAKAEN